LSDEGTKSAAVLFTGVKDSSNKYPTPFNLGSGISKDVFQWYESEGEYEGHRFHVAMTGAGKIFPGRIFTDGFDWASLPNGSVVVDVGGSVGSATHQIHKSYPHLHHIVQDLEKVVKYDAPKYWEAEMPSALAGGMVTFQANSFFESQPVKGAAVYFMRSILHDWPDEKCVQILRILREAASPSSRVVVFDMLVPYACKYDGPFAEAIGVQHAPYPLLPNLGLGAGGFVTMVDMQMMGLLNGKERTVTGFIELGRQSGWKLEKVVPGKMVALTFSPA